MDHAGAVLGPLLASLFLYFYPEEYRTLFALTIVPGVVVILILLTVPEVNTREIGNSSISTRITLSALPKDLYRVLVVILIFSLGNASDAFLLLRLSDLGVATFWIPLLWSALHVVKSSTSVMGGHLSDQLGRRQVIALGWMVYAAVYAAFALFDTAAIVVPVFLVYGLYFGLTEGVEKAWVADLSPANVRGTAFGVYNAVLGLGGLAASLLFGAVWTRVSAPAAFFTGAGLAAVATVLLYTMTASAVPAEHRPV
jgi:MFS family permease